MIELKREAIKHYERMIAWVEKQNLKKFTSSFLMYEGINEIWGSEYCSYCNYYSKLYELVFVVCSKCELGKNGFCCNGLYNKMVCSKTWGTWLKYARQVLQYIKDNG